MLLIIARVFRSTNYYYPNASDPRKVTDLQTKIMGDDSTFLVDQVGRLEVA
jgi:hypothetical protein